MKELRLEDLSKQELIILIRTRSRLIRKDDLMMVRHQYLNDVAFRLAKDHETFDLAMKKWHQADELEEAIRKGRENRGPHGATEPVHR